MVQEGECKISGLWNRKTEDQRRVAPDKTGNSA